MFHVLLVFWVIFAVNGRKSSARLDLMSILEGVRFRADNVTFHFKNLNVRDGKIEFDEMSVSGNSVIENESDEETSASDDESIDWFDYPQLVESIDNSIDPCNDFYEHVCHKWTDSNHISDDETSIGHMDLLTHRVHSQIQEILEDNYTSDTTKEQKIVFQFYEKCMDHKKSPDNKAYNQLLGQLAKVHGSKNDSILTNWMIAFRPMNFFVDVSVGINELNSSQRVLQIMPSHPTLSHNAYTRNEYRHEYRAMRQFLGQLLDLIQNDDINETVFGGRAEEYEARIEAFFEIDHQLAQIAYSDQYNKTTTMTTYYDLQNVFGSVLWDKYFTSFMDVKTIELLKSIEIQIVDKEGLSQIDKIIQNTNRTKLEYYLDWEAIMYFGEFFDSRYQEVMQGYNVAVSGAKTQSKEKDCMSTTSTIFYDLVAQIYVRKYFPSSTRMEVEEMVGNIVESFEDMLINNQWMDKSTKSEALDKLYSMKRFIGFNDQIFNETWIQTKYRHLKLDEMADTYYTSMLRIQQWTQNVILSRLNTSRTIQEFEFPSTDVNAFYDPTSNSIALTAAILQSPYFNVSLPSSINYGAIGIAIGHEITHGFDNSGAEYDKMGNRKNWWDSGTMKTFMNMSKCFIDQYSNITVDTTDLTIDGRLTLNENIADNGGIRAAIQALKKQSNDRIEKIRGLESKTALQLFFYSNAHVWCSKVRPQQILSRLYSDVHSPEKWRINTVFSNQPEFSKEFGCPIGTNMNPVKKCKVW